MCPIIKCTEKDLDQIMTYVSAEPEFNLFVIGDIENYGLGNDTVDIHVNVVDGKWDSLILRYIDNYIVYSQNKYYDTAAVANFLKDAQIGCISGKESIIEPLSPYFESLTLRVTYLSRLDALNPLDSTLPAGLVLKPLTPQDAKAVINLYLIIEEFAVNYRGREEQAIEAIALNLEKGGSGYGIFDNHRLLSVAATSASNSQSAMVIGVATHPGSRKQGLASHVLTHLCDVNLKAGKNFLCLFYDNPEAGAIYRRLGFKEMGQYALLR